MRAGVGYASSTGEFRVSIPVGVNYLFDISPQLSFIETGLGVTWAEESIWKTGFQNSSSEYEAGFFASRGYPAPDTVWPDVEDRLYSLFYQIQNWLFVFGAFRRLEFLNFLMNCSVLQCLCVISNLSTARHTTDPSFCSQRHQNKDDPENDRKACNKPDQCQCTFSRPEY